MTRGWQLGSRYTLERQIGSGAMGQVWVGHDVDGRTLAFKLLRPEMADDPSVVTRFLQERHLLVGLRSPYVIRVEDLVIEGPRLAIVMEYIAGASLRSLLQRRGNLPPTQVATLGARIARGLAAVHAAGVLHRDLKPENVLLDDTSGELIPKLADFGIASLAVTQTGHVATANVIGTPQYLAPELGDGKPSGRASDLYALGITLYEMASGTVPFLADSPVALLRLHADHAPGRPPGIPDPLWSIIAALLIKNPQDRPHDATAVATQLEALAPHLVAAVQPRPLRTPPPTTLLGASPAAPAHPRENAPLAPRSAATHPPASNSRRGALVAAVIVVTLLLVALVTWLLTSDSTGSSTARSHQVPAQTQTAHVSPPATMTAPGAATGGRSMSLDATLVGGAQPGPVSIAGVTYQRGLTPQTQGTSCRTSTQFALDGGYSSVTFLAGFTHPALTGAADVDATLHVLLDGRRARTVRLTARSASAVTADIGGATRMDVEIEPRACTARVVLAQGTLTSTP